MFFSGITPKILTFVYYAKNKTYSEVNFICVYQVWSKLIEKCLSKIEDGRHEIQFFDICTSDRGDFPFIIVIALFSLHFDSCFETRSKNVKVFSHLVPIQSNSDINLSSLVYYLDKPLVSPVLTGLPVPVSIYITSSLYNQASVGTKWNKMHRTSTGLKIIKIYLFCLEEPTDL